MRPFILLVFVTVMMIPISAQDGLVEARYRLREPDTQAYVDHVQQVVEVAETEYVYRESFNIDLFAEVSAMEDEINWRFLDHDRLTYDQLATIYRAYTNNDYGMVDETPPGKSWLKQLVTLWLEENPINLDEVSEFMMDDYRIEVTSLISTLKNHGGVHWGYFLRLIPEAGHPSENFIAIVTDNGYMLPELPSSVDSNLLAWGDLNADGDPDIAYLHSDHIGNSYSSGGMIIASLRGGNHFEKLTSLGYFHAPHQSTSSAYNWWFTNLGDGKTSVIQSQNLGSNWYCKFVQTKVFAWDESDQLVNQSTKDNFPDTIGCRILRAEQAMWSHNYSDAVTLYEKAFETADPPEDLMPHTQIRLGLAYLLTDQFEKADAIFQSLHTSESDYVQNILATYQQDARALPVCQTMYNYPFDGDESLQSNGYFETYDGGFNRFNAGIFYFSLENATCDLGNVLDSQLQTMTFHRSGSPLPQIENLGVKVANAIEIDFDMDGRKEWLIWLDAPGVAPMFFSIAGDHYEVTRLLKFSPILRQATEYNHYTVMTLPNGREQALINVDYDIDRLSEINCAGSCGGGYETVSCGYGDKVSASRHGGSMKLWRMTADTIVYDFMLPVCGLVDVNDIVSNGQAPHDIHAGKYVRSPENEFVVTVMPAVYSWDDELATYILPPEATATPKPTATPEPQIVIAPQEPVVTLSSYGFVSLRSRFSEADYQAVVRMVDQALSDPSNQFYDVAFESAFLYYRAMALEALN